MTLAHEFPGLAFIVAHHDRKMAADDVFDTVSGTLGLIGGVDTIAILKRSGQGGVTLHIQGRDLVDDVEKAVRFDRETCRWVILGEAIEVHRSAERARVLSALREGPAAGLSVGEIMAEAEIHSRQAAWQLLHRMAKDGEVGRRGRGKYGLPETPLSGVSGSQENGQPIDGTLEKFDPDPPDSPDKGGHPKVIRLYPRERVWKRVHGGVKAPSGSRWDVGADGSAQLHAHYSFSIGGKRRWVDHSLRTADPGIAAEMIAASRRAQVAQAKARVAAERKARRRPPSNLE
jgi:hypothetical protein